MKPFEIETGVTTKFVFDIDVVKKGQTDEYNLLPVIAKSGTVGKGLKEEEFEEEECTIDEDCEENEVCVDGECEELEEKTECDSDEDCEENEVCVYNVCKKNETVSMTGDFVLLVSDKEADISDFDSLIVDFSKARVFRQGDELGFEEFSIEGTSVDLTEVIGEKAITVLNVELSEGWYNKVELHVSATNGIVNGSSVKVDVPSGRLQVIRPFKIESGEETKFVFDIHVVRKGFTNEYNLRPVIGKSGIVGKDMHDDDVNETECTIDDDCEEGETCVNGECKEPEPECVTDEDCEENEICTDGECVEIEPECINDTDCDVNQTCVNQTCTDIIPEPECINDTDCDVNETCVNETCVLIQPPECTGNENRSCYTGLPETIGVGLCQEGLEYCVNETWSGVCTGEVTPANEICDGLDNDCDTETDEGNPNGGASCDTGEDGICAEGTEMCVGGSIACVRNQEPTTEMCDSLDNDCDGTMDEDFPTLGQPCDGPDTDLCMNGFYTCRIDGTDVECVNESPTDIPEVCDEIDNDCDGTVDEGCP